MSKKIIIANWKMNPTSQKEAMLLFGKITAKSISLKTEVVICPPFVYLERLKKNQKQVILGAQNIFSEERGAFTGEISAPMLSELGIKYVILGHSDRRKLGENNEIINQKIKMTLFFGLKPIVCVGEITRDEDHNYFNVIKNQIQECLHGIDKKSISKITIAYEPVWSLSTTRPRKDATPADSREMAIFIRKILTDKFGVKTRMPRILYGGSVDNKNCQAFISEGGVDGVLVGGASLNVDKFLEIINIVENIE